MRCKFFLDGLVDKKKQAALKLPVMRMLKQEFLVLVMILKLKQRLQQ